MTVLAVAATSARMLAEAAAADGFDVVALDLFGDADTRHASVRWQSIGQPGTLTFDTGRVLSALEALARRGDVSGWIAGSGFEGRPDLLEQGSGLLRLIGTAASAVRRIRNPEEFQRVLAAHGIACPPTRVEEPVDTAGWLLKDARGCGGWHIRTAASQRGKPLAAHHYFQREMRGMPMSATFLANGVDVAVLGFNRLIVRPFGTRPFVYCGTIGPVDLDPGVARRVAGAARTLAVEFDLRGLCSLDFVLDGAATFVLEINPRPPASMASYGRAMFHDASEGVVHAHVRACTEARLPRLAAPSPTRVRGSEIVFARCSMRLDERAAQHLAARPDCHDLPAAGAQFDRGDPLCSVSAEGTNAAQVMTLLKQGREAVLQALETPT